MFKMCDLSRGWGGPSADFIPLFFMVPFENAESKSGSHPLQSPQCPAPPPSPGGPSGDNALSHLLLLSALLFPLESPQEYKYQKAALKAGLVCRPSTARRLACLPSFPGPRRAEYFGEWDVLGPFSGDRVQRGGLLLGLTGTSPPGRQHYPTAAETQELGAGGLGGWVAKTGTSEPSLSLWAPASMFPLLPYGQPGLIPTHC